MIRTFFKFLFRTFFWICAIVGFVIVSFSLLFYFVGFRSLSPSPPHLAQESVLSLTFNGSYLEHTSSNGIESLILGKKSSLYDITRAITHAAQNPKIKGLVINIKTPDFGPAQIQEIRDAILAFRKTGKPSWCYTATFGELSSGTSLYYLATACEEIWIQPLGAVNLTGINIEIPFAKTTLEKLGVKPEMSQRKEYKSFIEMFTRDDPSESNKEAQKAIADSLLSQFVDGIAKERTLSHDQVRDLIINGPYLTEEARLIKLIDRVAYYQSLKPAIQQKLGELIGFIDLTSYLDTLSEDRKGDKVALIFGSGIIQRDGKSSSLEGMVIGSDATSKAFQEAIKSENIKAIVYRVNSSGGSPIASEAIYNVIQHTKEHAKKPVIISMSDAAASGGYWISLAGSKIVAQPATLTGSIGVFGGKFMLSGLFEQLGVKWAHISTSENATMWSINESYTPAQWLKLNAWIDQIYDAFTTRVALNRKMTPLQVEKVARGRVWTGEQALALGLIDQLGGIQTALDLAKKEAGLAPDVGVEIYPKQLTVFEVISSLFENGEENSLSEMSIFGTFLRPFTQLYRLFTVALSSQELLYTPLGEVK